MRAKYSNACVADHLPAEFVGQLMHSCNLVRCVSVTVRLSGWLCLPVCIVYADGLVLLSKLRLGLQWLSSASGCVMRSARVQIWGA